MRKREGDGCPIAGALQLVGDKWTLLVVRDLAGGPRRTTELIDGLFPISSRTLVDRLRDMEGDGLIERMDYGGQPPHVEYRLTERGLSLLPVMLVQGTRFTIQPQTRPAILAFVTTQLLAHLS